MCHVVWLLKKGGGGANQISKQMMDNGEPVSLSQEKGFTYMGRQKTRMTQLVLGWN